jgi:hypothetical protein
MAVVVSISLALKTKSGPDYSGPLFALSFPTIVQRPLPVGVKVEAKVKVVLTINHGNSVVQVACLRCKPTAGIPNNKMLFWQGLCCVSNFSPNEAVFNRFIWAEIRNRAHKAPQTGASGITTAARQPRAADT